MNAHLLSIGLLGFVTVCYAGYNLLVKVSGNHVPVTATTTVFATICLQVAALLVSLVFLSVLIYRGGHVFHLGARAYSWAALAGVCIGMAEIGYFYLFGGVGGLAPMAANIAIPAVVGGAIAAAMLFSVVLLKEPVGWNQWCGSGLIVLGVILFFITTDPVAKAA